MKSNEIENERDEIKQWENKIKRKDLKYEANKYKCDFRQLDNILIIFILILYLYYNLYR